MWALLRDRKWLDARNADLAQAFSKAPSPMFGRGYLWIWRILGAASVIFGVFVALQAFRY
jgi:hypothetical protein